MKKHTTIKQNVNRHLAMVLLLAGMAFIGAAPVLAAPGDNTATGDIGGVAADLTDSATFNLTATTLAIQKTAYLASNNTQLVSGSVLPKGTVVNFLIYIDNTSPVPVNDVSIADVLDTATFGYVNGSMKVLNTTDSTAVAATTVQDIYVDVIATGTVMTEAADPLVDVASFVSPNLTAGSQGVGTNATLNIAASKVWAMVYSVTML